MKKLCYGICSALNTNTEQAATQEKEIYRVEMTWSEANEQIAGRESHDGTYVIVDDV